MKKAAQRSKRNRHTGRINAAKQRILDASAPLNTNSRIVGFQEYVTRVIGDRLYKGLRNLVGVGTGKNPATRDTVTLVRTTFRG